MSEGKSALEQSESARYCVGCGYNLRGLESARCPECGMEFDKAGHSSLAWEHRRRLGRRKAFWATMRMAACQPRRLAESVGGPVNYRSARNFRWIVAGMAALPFMIF